MHNPFISVVVTTYNWPQALKAVLLALSAQSYRGFEIVVADDGSTSETAELIKTLRPLMSIPIQHVFQADEGFRAAKIRNKAIQAASGEYIIFLDGDCIPRPSFVKNHLHLAQKRKFVVGNRVLLTESFTQKMLAAALPLHQWSFARWIKTRLQGSCNQVLSFLTLPLGPLRILNAKAWRGAKGCNLGVWKADLQRINGWEERFQGWGYEDSDLVIRLIRAGVKRKSGRFATAVIHLWHKINDRTGERDNWTLLSTRFNTKHKCFIAENGLNQYQGL